MKYYKGLKIRRRIVVGILMVILFVAMCITESTQFTPSQCFNFVIGLCLIVSPAVMYWVSLSNRIEDYEEKHHIVKYVDV